MISHATFLAIIGLVTGFSTPFQAVSINTVGISRTLKYGYRYGLLLGFGSSLVQFLFSILGVLCIYSSKNLNLIFTQQIDFILNCIGVIILGWYGFKIYREKVDVDNINSKDVRHYSAVKTVFSGMALSIIKPGRIILYSLIFAGFGVHYYGYDLLLKLPLMLGVFFGSLFWWFFFLKLILKYKNKMMKKVVLLNHIGGGILMGLSAVALLLLI